MSTLDLRQWLCQTEMSISTVISNAHSRNWDEDHLSRLWITTITAPTQPIILNDGDQSSFSVGWDVYKADGTLEEKQGDIAFLVRLNFNSNHSITGVGFLEAKRIYPNGKNEEYTALKRSQLELQCSRVANHKLLLYDYKPIVEALPNLIRQGFCQQCHHEFKAVHAAVLPTQHALAIDKRNRDLNALSTPLSYQICCRYLRGLDLDYQAPLVQAVRDGAAGGIRYLFVGDSIISGEAKPSPQTVEVNTKHYHLIKPDDNLKRQS